MIEAMHVTYQGDSKAVEAQSDLFTSMADSVDECVDIVKDARLQMDAIDREAHEAIQKIIDSKGGWFGPLAMLSMIWAILVQARTAAEAASAAAAANIGTQAARVESSNRALAGQQAGPPVQAAPYRPDGSGHSSWRATRCRQSTSWIRCAGALAVRPDAAISHEGLRAAERTASAGRMNLTRARLAKHPEAAPGPVTGRQAVPDERIGRHDVIGLYRVPPAPAVQQAQSGAPMFRR